MNVEVIYINLVRKNDFSDVRSQPLISGSTGDILVLIQLIFDSSKYIFKLNPRIRVLT
jgi:hypothetical protein